MDAVSIVRDSRRQPTTPRSVAQRFTLLFTEHPDRNKPRRMLTDVRLYEQANAMLSRLCDGDLPEGVTRNSAGRVELGVLVDNYEALAAKLEAENL